MKTVVLFGGSGFIGRNLIGKLLQRNFRVKIVTRDQEKVSFLKTFASCDFLSLQQWNYENFNELDSILEGSDAVINLIGILAENKKGDFKKYHSDFAGQLAEKCAALQVEYFLHLSALGIEKAKTSLYAQSKIEGERLVLEHFPKATILKPSIIFGPEDNFFNKFAQTVKVMPFLPLINGGKTKFQPIYVEDVSDIICQSISNRFYQGKRYEIGGDTQYSFKTLMEFVGSYCHKDIIFIPLNFFQAKLLARFLQIFTNTVITTDQVEILRTDNILNDNSFKKDFKIHPKAVEQIVPNYVK